MSKKVPSPVLAPAMSTRKKNPRARQKPIEGFTGRSSPRQLQPPKRLWYNPRTWRVRKQRKPRMPVPDYRPLSKARAMLVTSFRQLWGAKKVVGGILLIYGLLNIILVKGFSTGSDVQSLKQTIDSIGNGGAYAHLTSAVTSFSYLLATSGSSSSNQATSGIYQYLLLLVCSLAFIWVLRQLTAKHAVRIRDGFYKGMYPLIPFIFVIFVICLQLLPLAIGLTLFSFILSNGIISNVFEGALFAVPTALLCYWSLRMLTASVFAMYVVTLPDMTPLRALRSAKQLVYGRRLLLLRKLLFLPVALLVFACLVELPLILFITVLAPWMFFVLSVIAFAVVHGYLYTLYREML